ncbi:MAG: iron-siderophore ABC transporter substrate-binding protein [Homoserinimonas sp.]
MSFRPRLAALAAATAALLVLSGCASAADDATDEPAGSGVFPVTMEHAFGQTKIPSEPQRVVALGWGSADAAIAMGVIPVGMEAQAYGGDENGVQPWTAEALEEVGAETPILIPSSNEAPAYEQIAEAAPDLILAVYSGITEEQYELLSEIAPTVAYADAPWTTPWRDVVTTVGEALGRFEEAQSVLDGVDAVLAEKASEVPELAGKTVAVVWDVSGTFYVYKPADSRVSFLFDLGLENAPSVDELSNGESPFYFTLSYEELDKLESDIVVAFANTQEEAGTFLAQSYAQTIPAVKAGAVASVSGVELVAAVSPPTALSLTWGIDEYVAELAEAASAVE